MTAKILQNKLMQFIKEGRAKPALAAAKFCLESEMDESGYEQLCYYALELLQILAEIDDPIIDFKDVYAVVSSLRRNSLYFPTIQISLIMHKLRTRTINDEEIEDLLNSEFNSDDLRVLVCRSIVSIFYEQFGDAYEYLTQAILNDVSTTRSILCAFEKHVLQSFREGLIEAREKQLINCSCSHNGATENLGYQKSFVNIAETFYCEKYGEEQSETSFTTPLQTIPFTLLQVCQLHRTITEIDDVIRLIEMKDWDRTAILNEYIKAKRFSYADRYIHVNLKYINESQIDEFEKTLKRESKPEKS